MAVEGTLDLFQLPEILQLISQQKKTGILTVQGQNDIVAISFLAGRIVAADALNQTMEEGLTRVLVAEGMLSPQALSGALAEHPSVGGRLIDFLVERRHVTRQRLLAAIRLQTYSLIEQLLLWDQGDFKFYTGEEVSYEEGFVPITVEELLLNAGGAAARERTPRAPMAPIAPVAPIAPAVPSAPARPSRPPLRAVPPPDALPPLPPLQGLPASPPPAARPQVAAPARPPFPVPAPQPPQSSPSIHPPATEPPAAIPTAFRRMKVEELAVPRSFRAVGRIAALVPILFLVAFLLTDPGLLLLPFPWQEASRQGLALEQRSALYMKIDRAAKTFFLLEARFPEKLAQLRQLNLLSGADLRDPQGHELRYAAREESYAVRPVDSKGAPIVGAETTEAVTGNFLLDSEFISVSPDAQAPLILLD